MHDYELVVLVSPQVADEEVSAVAERISKLVTDRGGKIAEMKPWGRRRMAYNIKDFQEANYLQANFSMDPGEARDLEASLHLSEEVIRHMLVVDPPKKPVETPKVAQAPSTEPAQPH